MMCDRVSVGIVMNMINNEKPLNVLDIGAGYGFWGYILKAHLDHEPTVTGIEINPDNYARLERLNLYDHLIECDASIIPNYWIWSTKSYDLAILSHVVEHMEKERALKLLSHLKHQCDQVIVICPEGDALCVGGEFGSSHISKWTAEDFRGIGMSVRRLALSHRAGRVVSCFERFYFKLKGLTRGGVLIAW